MTLEFLYRAGSWEAHTPTGPGCVVWCFGLTAGFLFFDEFCKTHPREDEGRDFLPHPAGPEPHGDPQ